MTGHHSGERIVLASNNAGKVREINQLLASEQITVVAQKDFNIPDAIEDGLSFVENAIKKARHASSLSGLPAIADDSGIEVDALNGAPGIYSARFAGPEASDEENLQKLLSR
ncbi:MAG: non-canonical purine NTP pyrophosphatase, partial [Candidatus Thiodiazotropha sp. (ex. Lucinisca nassula)]|nr:non-canonical purine NTP pyrophosphatase [Candidatus Thiodiazotropha sp. (ex. Lucinisca nassula)]